MSSSAPARRADEAAVETSAPQPSAPASAPRAGQPVVALLGNPNSGKTTLFNAVTGLSAKVGNYPGITVEHREGALSLPDGVRARVLDLPGTYSLVPRAEDEAVAVAGLLGQIPGARRPELVVAVVDATSIERNLYLLAQLREWWTGPLVVALTLMDTVEADGTRIDRALLERRLGLPVVAVSAVRRHGVDALNEAIFKALSQHSAPAPLPLPLALPAPAEQLEQLARRITDESGASAPADTLAAWALAVQASQAPLRAPLSAETLAQVQALPLPQGFLERLIAARYERVRGWLDGVVTRPQATGEPRSSRLTRKIDQVVLHRVFGPVLMVLVFAGLFQALFSWSTPVMDAIEGAVKWLGASAGGLVPESMPLLRSLVVDGLFAGVGNVVVFIPQIAVLFFALGLLEDSGYLARAAFLLDRLMARVGLHGRAFVPMLTGFACAVPAIMAARTIENRRDRLITILVTPLMSCSARLPVYGLMIATVFATMPPVFGVLQVGALVMIAMYALSIFAALGMAALFRRSILRGPPPPFVLELPTYRVPRLGQLFRHVWTRVRRFLIEAGTVILAITVVLWGLFNFPRSDALAQQEEAEKARIESTIAAGEAQDEALSTAEAHYAQKRLEYSVAGRLGHAIEPVIRPLGFDWKVGVGLVASFAAREVLVSTLGLVYGLGDGSDEESPSLREAMREDRDAEGRPVHTPLSGLSLMVFFVLAMQCMSTLAAVRRETQSWTWPAFQFGYMTLLAYLAAFAVFQGGKLLGLG